jgi:predicted AAA+ superfamily ATPase
MNFQSESKKSGDAFEELVFEDLVSKDFDYIQPNVYINGAGCEVDFVAYNSLTNTLEYVEAKGGLDGDNKRPGAKRTDNVKKAIANGALIKAVDDSLYYVVYFSAEPGSGYATEMIYTALKNKIIDEVRYLLPQDLTLQVA